MTFVSQTKSYKKMKACTAFYAILSITTIALLSACTRQQQQNAVYYWRTTFKLDNTERDFLKEHKISRMYIRYFDVVPAGEQARISHNLKIECRHRFPFPIFSLVSVKNFLLSQSSRCLCIEQERVSILTVYYSGYSKITIWVTDYWRGLNKLRINVFYCTSLLCIKVLNPNAYINKVNKYTNQQS